MKADYIFCIGFIWRLLYLEVGLKVVPSLQSIASQRGDVQLLLRVAVKPSLAALRFHP